MYGGKYTCTGKSIYTTPPPPPQPFYGPFSETTRVTGARRELLDFMVQGRSPFFTGWMLFLPPNQQCQSTEGN